MAGRHHTGRWPFPLPFIAVYPEIQYEQYKTPVGYLIAARVDAFIYEHCESPVQYGETTRQADANIHLLL